jgi:hypothetical protein
MLNKRKQLRLSKSFKVSEFLCSCGECYYSHRTCNAFDLVDPIFIQKLQGIRDDIDKSMKILSGARCSEYNQRVGGAENSAHLVSGLQPACAADISTSNWSALDRFLLIRAAYKYGMHGIGVYENFVHLDNKKRKALWYGGY